MYATFYNFPVKAFKYIRLIVNFKSYTLTQKEKKKKTEINKVININQQVLLGGQVFK